MTYRKQLDYEPFGATIAASNDLNRTSFIGKEKDRESNLGDFGVRKYDNDIGRFTSIDPLWEKYYGWTPYHYCRNNPLRTVDPNGNDEFYKTDGTHAFHYDNPLNPNNDGQYITAEEDWSKPSKVLVSRLTVQLPSKEARQDFVNQLNKVKDNPQLQTGEKEDAFIFTMNNKEAEGGYDKYNTPIYNKDGKQIYDAYDINAFIKDYNQSTGNSQIMMSIHTHGFSDCSPTGMEGASDVANASALNPYYNASMCLPNSARNASNPSINFFDSQGPTISVPLTVFITVGN